MDNIDIIISHKPAPSLSKGQRGITHRRRQKMATNTTTKHTTKVFAHRLAQLKEKMAALRQEEERICQSLAHDLAQCLIHAQALEMDFDTLIGGVLEVVNQAQANLTKACPVQSQRLEAWKKSGEKFRRRLGDPRGQNERNTGGEKQERQEGQREEKQGSYQPKPSTQQNPLPAVPKPQKGAEKIT